MARSQLEKNLPATASAVFWPDEQQSAHAPAGKHVAPTQHQVFHAKAMVSKTVNLASTLFKHTRGLKPPSYLAQVVNYTQSSDKFDVIFLHDYPEEVLRQFICSYSGKVKKGVKSTGPAVEIYEYSASAFWNAFLGYAGHRGYPMKSSYVIPAADNTHAQVSAACQTTSPEHPAASSEEMPFSQQLPSFGYMLLSSNKSGVQQHGCDLVLSKIIQNNIRTLQLELAYPGKMC